MSIKHAIGFFAASGPSYCAEATAFFARMDVQPSSALKDLIDKTIVDLKTANLWDKIDVLRFMNLHTQQASLLNIKTADFGNGSNVNSLPWVAKLGFRGTNTSDGKYINSQFNPSPGGYNFTQNSGFMGVYQTESAEYERQAITNTASLVIIPRGTSNTSYRCRTYINNAAATNQDAGLNGGLGLTIGLRTNSSQIRSVRNATFGTLRASNSVAIPNSTMGELGQGAISYNSRIALTIYGGGINTQEEHTALYNILKYQVENVGIYGEELVLNGGFDNESEWTIVNGWSISGGTANWTYPGSGNRMYNSNLNVIKANKAYRISFNISGLTTFNRITFHNPSGSTPCFTAPTNIYGKIYNGLNVWYVYGANDTANLAVWVADDVPFSLDNLSIKEIL